MADSIYKDQFIETGYSDGESRFAVAFAGRKRCD